MHEARGVFHARGIRLGIGTVERQVELEIGELLFDGMELVHIGSLLQRTGTVPERHGALGLFGLEQMH